MPSPRSSSASSARRSTERCAMPGRPSSGFSTPEPGTGEERVDEVAQVEARLADELPEGAGAPEASQAGGRKGAHASNLRIPSRAAAPKATASPTSQAASRARVDQGSLS